jgi:hypothetical protein
MGMLFLITLTHDTKRYSHEEAWGQLSRRLTVFKNHIRRVTGASLRSITVKEGTESGYPAPHMLLVIDRPIQLYAHKGKKGGTTWRLQNRALLNAIKEGWQGGYVDVQALVSEDTRSPVSYVSKYLVKSVHVGGKYSALAINQFAWQKHFNLRPYHVSSQFKEILNRTYRLDTYRDESHQPKPHYWVYDSSQNIALPDFYDIIRGKAG